MIHTLDIIENAAPVTIPIPRTPEMDWPGSGDTAFVPAALILAARGRCSCRTCLADFVRMHARTHVHAA